MKTKTKLIISTTIMFFGVTGVYDWYVYASSPVVVDFHRNTESRLYREIKVGTSIDWTKERIIDEIKTVFPEEPRMVKVAECESGFKPEAKNENTNGTVDRGIMQVNSTHGFEGDLHDVPTNLKYARQLYDERGLKPWLSSVHCWTK